MVQAKPDAGKLIIATIALLIASTSSILIVRIHCVGVSLSHKKKQQNFMGNYCISHRIIQKNLLVTHMLLDILLSYSWDHTAVTSNTLSLDRNLAEPFEFNPKIEKSGWNSTNDQACSYWVELPCLKQISVFCILT